jgi:Domain of unknown function (DUF4402)
MKTQALLLKLFCPIEWWLKAFLFNYYSGFSAINHSNLNQRHERIRKEKSSGIATWPASYSSYFLQTLITKTKIQMKMKNKVIAAAILLTGFVTNANAQSTAYASTTAVLVTPISIAKTTDMHFGTVASSSTAGTVVLDYADGRTATGGASLPAGSITQTTAVFDVTGEGTSSFAITIPTSAITLTGSVSGTMTVDNFFCNAGAATTLSGGTKTLKVKATLNVPANTVAGTYSNALANSSALFVTVNYN